MKYLNLEIIKNHLNLDQNFDADDFYLNALYDVAVEAVSKYIDVPLSQLEDENGKLPSSVLHAMLLLIGTWYSVRESVSSASMMPVPHAVEFLCDLNRDYRINKFK